MINDDWPYKKDLAKTSSKKTNPFSADLFGWVAGGLSARFAFVFFFLYLGYHVYNFLAAVTAAVAANPVAQVLGAAFCARRKARPHESVVRPAISRVSASVAHAN